jgi:hypothetical protein
MLDRIKMWYVCVNYICIHSLLLKCSRCQEGASALEKGSFFIHAGQSWLISPRDQSNKKNWQGVLFPSLGFPIASTPPKVPLPLQLGLPDLLTHSEANSSRDNKTLNSFFFFFFF